MLLRHVYGEAFGLLGVVCAAETRKQRISSKYKDAGHSSATDLMGRDEKEGPAWGQRVADVFHLADAFLDNTESRYENEKTKESNPAWGLPDEVTRFIKVVTQTEILRPTLAEVGMFAAYGAQLKSACLSRQVGAALLDRAGNILATGTNEVPKAGGGVYEYWDCRALSLETSPDKRCAAMNPNS